MNRHSNDTARRHLALYAAVVWGALGTGCAKPEPAPPPASSQPPVLPTVKPTVARNQAVELRKALKIEKRPGDIEEEEGRIVRVWIDETAVRDITPLKGLPLKELRLNFTAVSDIGPLKGMPLTKLYLEGTPVKDISVVKTLSLNSLWLNGTNVSDLSSLEGKSLESLDISGTPASDLSPLIGMTSLKRLNIARSKVTDLTPLKGLKLERLIFSPEKITRGLDVVRRMASLKKLDTTFPMRRKFLTPTQFWESLRKGTLPRD